MYGDLDSSTLPEPYLNVQPRPSTLERRTQRIGVTQKGGMNLTPSALCAWNHAGGQSCLQVRAIMTLMGSSMHHATTINTPCTCKESCSNDHKVFWGAPACGCNLQAGRQETRQERRSQAPQYTPCMRRCLGGVHANERSELFVTRLPLLHRARRVA